MAWSRARKLTGLVVLLLALAVIVNVIAMLLEHSQWAIDAAEAACRERGLELDEGSGTKSVVTSNFLGMTAEIEFKGRRRNRATTIRVNLRKPLHFLGWQVDEVREELGD
jgi:hypothetical protein